MQSLDKQLLEDENEAENLIRNEDIMSEPEHQNQFMDLQSKVRYNKMGIQSICLVFITETAE